MPPAACAVCLPKSDQELMDRPCNQTSLDQVKSEVKYTSAHFLITSQLPAQHSAITRYVAVRVFMYVRIVMYFTVHSTLSEAVNMWTGV